MEDKTPVESKMSWQEMVVKLVDMLSEDKLVAMVCLTGICFWTVSKFPIDTCLPVVTAVVSGISGFVVGRKMK